MARIIKKSTYKSEYADWYIREALSKFEDAIESGEIKAPKALEEVYEKKKTC